MDIYADSYYSLTPYQFANNDPIFYNDPNGDQYAYMDGNGNKWHGQDPLAGTAGAGISYQPGFGFDGFGDRNFMPGNGGGSGSLNERKFDWTKFWVKTWNEATKKIDTSIPDAETGLFYNYGNLSNTGIFEAKDFHGIQSYAEGERYYFLDIGIHVIFKDVCWDCTNPMTIGQNMFGLTYPGGNNPMTYNRDFSYSYVPKRLSEYPAIGHDRRYDRLGTEGLKGLLTDRRAIGADWRFVAEEFSIAENPFVNPIDRFQAGLLGLLLGTASLPKTVAELSRPSGAAGVIMWYNYSNVGVSNLPDVHNH